MHVPGADDDKDPLIRSLSVIIKQRCDHVTVSLRNENVIWSRITPLQLSKEIQDEFLIRHGRRIEGEPLSTKETAPGIFQKLLELTPAERAVEQLQRHPKVAINKKHSLTVLTCQPDGDEHITPRHNIHDPAEMPLERAANKGKEVAAHPNFTNHRQTHLLSLLAQQPCEPRGVELYRDSIRLKLLIGPTHIPNRLTGDV